MKPFEYYSTTKVKPPSISEYRQRLIDEIMSAKMTATERQNALDSVSEKVMDWFKKENKPYLEEQANLHSEFWADCRKDLGYDLFLNDKGCSALEYYAWERGHSAGYSEVYNYLIDLADLAKKLVDNRRVSTE